VLSALALDGLPEVTPGEDLAGLIAAAFQAQQALSVDERAGLQEGDVVVVAHKVVSKAEGRVRRLSDVRPTARARELADHLGKDPRHVQVVLDEAHEVRRADHGVLICVTHHGYVCANAGVDASNVPGEDAVVLLPEDPDGSARKMRERLRELTGVAPGVLITDSFGRAWRNGQCDVTLGCVGIAPLDDWRGRRDTTGRELKATLIAVADELAAAADLARQKDGRQPVVRIRGAARYVTDDDGPGARALVRPDAEDLFK
jgi:coenzyme F420-0:L-glutamate ligase/coenzyme F420-1:gamma-L-glutamate ligase